MVLGAYLRFCETLKMSANLMLASIHEDKAVLPGLKKLSGREHHKAVCGRARSIIPAGYYVLYVGRVRLLDH